MPPHPGPPPVGESETGYGSYHTLFRNAGKPNCDANMVRLVGVIVLILIKFMRTCSRGTKGGAYASPNAYSAKPA